MRSWNRGKNVLSVRANAFTFSGNHVVAQRVRVESERAIFNADRFEVNQKTSAAVAQGGISGVIDGWACLGTSLQFRRDGVLVSDEPFLLEHSSGARHAGQAFVWDPAAGVATLKQPESTMVKRGTKQVVKADLATYQEFERTARYQGSAMLNGVSVTEVVVNFVVGREGVEAAAVKTLKAE